MRILKLAPLVVSWAVACSDAGSDKSDNGDAGSGGQGAVAAGSGGSGMGASGGAAGNGGSAAGTGGSSGGSAGSGGSSAGSGGSAGATKDFYVGPNGNDRNAGTRDAPFKTLSKAHDAAQPGTTIWVLAGTNSYNASTHFIKSGTAGNPIRVFADSARPVLDFSMLPRGDSNARGIEIRGDYWHVKGLEIQDAGDNGILISGSHNIVENVVLHHNDDTGLQIMVSENQALDTTRGVDNLILNCDSYENWDQATSGENADGFAAKLRIGTGNVFRGCRAWNNADDGWDLFAADDVVVIEDCWAFMNGTTSQGSSPSGDGNGFKLGGDPSGPGQGGAVHQLRQNAGFENRSCGFTLNNNPDTPVLSECGIGRNRFRDYCDIDCSSDFTVSTTGAQAKALPRNTDGSLPAIR